MSLAGRAVTRGIPGLPAAHHTLPRGWHASAPPSGHIWGEARFSLDLLRKFAQPTGLASANLSNASSH